MLTAAPAPKKPDGLHVTDGRRRYRMAKRGLHALIAAVIKRAVDDLKGLGPRGPKGERDRAMEFILSETCEGWCLEIGADCEAVREKAASLYRRAAGKEKTPGRPRKRLQRTGIPSSPVKRRTDPF